MATKKSKKLGAGEETPIVDKSDDILEQIAELKDRMLNASEGDKDVVTQWDKLIRRAMLVKNLYEHDAIKMLFEFASVKVEQIDDALQAQTAAELANAEGLWKRARWEAEKSAFMWFVQIFDRAENTIKVINKSVKDNLNQ